MVVRFGAPQATIGGAIAMLVLSPETVAGVSCDLCVGAPPWRVSPTRYLSCRVTVTSSMRLPE
jgi:hypothetical protein